MPKPPQDLLLARTSSFYIRKLMPLNYFRCGLTFVVFQ
jgi:hypothetical protein